MSEVSAKQRMPSNDVYIGKKPVMTYVLACMTQFGEGQPEVHIKAMGRSISSAVDVAEIVRNRFLQNTRIKQISIGTQEVDGKNNEKTKVSIIDIIIAK